MGNGGVRELKPQIKRLLVVNDDRERVTLLSAVMVGAIPVGDDATLDAWYETAQDIRDRHERGRTDTESELGGEG